jgi:hypothetical protein
VKSEKVKAVKDSKSWMVKSEKNGKKTGLLPLFTIHDSPFTRLKKITIF